ncbi:hypothetical protein [Roseateles sp. YR242]|uniref:hypothetical protein n=1 Tax=Roseateles sp. YR242 TaxID=1855305 RepID=UPI0011609DB1|nr:hypothetical protein [Roseateles sp. YR242]
MTRPLTLCRFSGLVALTLACVLAAPHAAWSAPPPITLVTPFVEGSGPDHVARTVARHWARLAGEPVQVINMPENQGRTAARWVAHDATDERLMLLTSARMLDAGPLAPRGQRLRAPLSPPIPLDQFQLVIRVGELPFMTVLPKGLLPGALHARLPLRDVVGNGNGKGNGNGNADDNSHGDTHTQVMAVQRRLDEQSAHPADPVGRPQPAETWTQGPLAWLPEPPPRASVFPPLFNRPDEFPRTDWNGLLVSARMDRATVAHLRSVFETILALPEVRWAVAQAGTDLWEEIPPDEPVETEPLQR